MLVSLFSLSIFGFRFASPCASLLVSIYELDKPVEFILGKLPAKTALPRQCFAEVMDFMTADPYVMPPGLLCFRDGLLKKGLEIDELIRRREGAAAVMDFFYPD